MANPVLVCIGDSLTLGAYLDPSDTWIARLADRTKFASWTMVNKGIGGNTVIAPPPPGQQTMTDRFQADVLDVPGVSHCIIFGGINDCGQVDATTLAGALRDLYWRAANAGIQTHIATMTPLTTSYPYYAGIEPCREAVNAWLRAYFGGPPGLLDFGATLRTPSADVLDPLFAYNTDGLHFNFAGAVRVADIAERYLS